MTRMASIDIGTNTIRLLITDIDEANKPERILTERSTTRLGEGFVKNGDISSKAIERSIRVLKGYLNLANKCNVKKTLAGATSVVREAANRDEFQRKVYQNTGLEVQVLSETEEARITLMGVLSVIDTVLDRALVIDIGGGSTEFIITQGRNLIAAHSLDLGVVYLTERFIQSDPPSPLELKNLIRFIDNRLSYAKKYTLESQAGLSFSSLVGTAGTITTLAAINQGMSAYNPDKINRYILTRESVEGIYDMLKVLTPAERRILPGVEKGREDIIIAGTIVVLSIMGVFGFDEMIVSDYGLLEGLILVDI